LHTTGIMAPVCAAAAAPAPAVAADVALHTASFRDPSGFLFVRNGVLYRQVQTTYREHYDRLVSSGLLAALVLDESLILHEECDAAPATPGAYKILRPSPIDVISYPYEWSFGQLKAAALCTLHVQARALEHGMVLKDATAYNVQYQRGRPVFIDTLSFETYVEGRPWQAYRQFCQHFLAPLALMAWVDVRLGQSLRVYLDGLPLDLASRLLPRRTWLRPGLGMHIHWHAAAQRWYAASPLPTGAPAPSRAARVSRAGLLGILASLERAIEGLQWRPSGTEWADYESTHGYSEAAQSNKRDLVGRWFESMTPAPKRVIDLGANTGVFSRLIASRGASVIAADGDPAAVERNYRSIVAEQNTRILPLFVDLTNPSPGSGWAGEERSPFFSRAQADLALCLALVHHLAIGNNVPLDRMAAWFSTIAPRLIIEFVPKSDPQVQRLLASRHDVFGSYSAEAFEAAFAAYFSIQRRESIAGSERTLYQMQRRHDTGQTRLER
jgi:ribosomal protein L11 methylase PrmA